MDPDKCLEELRELVITAAEAGDGSFNEKLLEKFEALDQWLCRGGFLPKAWKGNQK